MIDYKELKKDSPLPIYYQIYSIIKKNILNNTIQNDKGILPSERELATKFNVTRVTMRQAMAELEKDSLICRERGKPAFVNKKPLPLIHNLSLPSVKREELSFIDKNPQIIELKRFETINNEEIKKNFGEKEPVFFIKRVFKISGTPIAVNRIWLRAKYVPKLDKIGLCVDSSLSKTLSEYYKIPLVKRTNIVETVRPSSSEIDLLKITLSDLILQINSLSFTENDVAYEYSTTSWIGDMVRLKVDMF